MDNNNNNTNTPARRPRAVSFTIQIVPDNESDEGLPIAPSVGGTATQQSQGTATTQDAADRMSQSQDDARTNNPADSMFTEMLESLTGALLIRATEGSAADEGCLAALTTVRLALEEAYGEYNSDPSRCPLISTRQLHKIGNYCKQLAETLYANGHDALLWSWILDPAVEVSDEIRLETAKLCLILADVQNDYADEQLPRDMNVDDLLRAVLISPRTPLRTYQTGILAVLMNDRKSQAMADMCVVPVEFDDPADPTRRVKMSLPRELCKRLKEEIAPKFLQGNATPDDLIEMQWSLRCMSFLGEYHEALPSVLDFDLVSLLIHILSNESTSEQILFEALELCSRLIAHKAFANRFVSANGVDLVLGIANRAPRPSYLFPSIGWCLSGIASINPVMERVLRSSPDTCKRLVDFELNLLRRDQDLARKNALSFFFHSFGFPAVLAQFDNSDGCKLLLDLLVNPSCSYRSIAIVNLLKHIVRALRDYFRAHIAHVAHLVRTTRVVPADRNKPARATAKRLPQNKPLSLDPVSHNRNLETLMSKANEVVIFLSQTRWRPVEELLQYRTDDGNSGVSLLLGVAKVCEREVGHNAQEALTCALQVLSMASILPIVHADICGTPFRLRKGYLRGSTAKTASNPTTTTTTGGSTQASSGANGENSVRNSDEAEEDDEEDEAEDEDDDDAETEDDEDGFAFGGSSETTGISVLLQVAASPGMSEEYSPKSVLAALQTLCNCVCSEWSGDETFHRQARALSRNNNAVMVLLALLNYKEKPADADPIRFYACDALFGLSHEIEVADILKALNVDRVLSEIANSEPVVAENKAFHDRLKQKALSLLNIISPGGRDEEIALAADAAAQKITRDAIVRRSNVQWNQKELMMIIHEHLDRYGCVAAAKALAQEAGLSRAAAVAGGDQTPRAQVKVWPVRANHKRRPRPALMRKRMLKGPLSVATQRKLTGATSTGKKLPAVTPFKLGFLSRSTSTKDESEGNVPATKAKEEESSSKRKVRSYTLTEEEDEQVKRQKLVSSADLLQNAALGPSSHPTMLERIVREHLRHQHQTCRNPVTTPPPFSLTDYPKRHHCPDVRPKTAPKNTVRRVLNRSLHPPFGGPQGHQITTRSLFSKAKYSRQYCFAQAPTDRRYSCVGFRALSGFDDQVLMGTDSGLVHKYKVWSTEYAGLWDLSVHLETDESFTEEEDFGISGLNVSSDGSFFVTSVKRGKSAVVWKVLDEQDVAVAFKLKDARGTLLDPRNDTVAAFVRNGQDKAGSGVAIYSLEAGGDQVVRFFPTEGYISNGYQLTNLCMSEGGTLVCYDGVLWDARRTHRPIHKFDKLSEFGWGGLHPNGLQLVLDKDVWDLRTYRIVQSCSNALHGSSFRFDPSGEVIYSYHDAMLRDESVEQDSAFNKSVVLTDATDFSSIASWNVDRSVYDLSVHPNGGSVALIVQAPSNFESEGRLYEIGRTAPDDDDADLDDAQVYPESPSDLEADGFEDEMEDEDEIIVDDLGGAHNFGDVIMRAINAISNRENGEEDDDMDDDDVEFDDDEDDEDEYEIDDEDDDEDFM